ncbi:MAG: hypothetical protein HYT48_00995 [Candidatus Vogelbacteria bacterium]|nr:hypothetical protein [Candidatus Vogelbacteria bacterium]
MARVTTMLTSAEKEEGGPYDMWLVPPDARDKWNDTDLVCNANIAYFLSLSDIYLPKVTAFIERKIESKEYEFPYNKIYPAIYFISRSYQGKNTEKMTRLLLRNQKKDGRWENPLRTALAISALINFSGEKYRERLERGIQYLLRAQGKSGGWKPYSFYFQMRTKKKTLYAGSGNITTALCLEAINKFSAEGGSASGGKIEIQKSQNEMYQKVVNMVKARFSATGEDLRKEAEKALVRTLKGDNGKQIVLLPYFFRESLGEKGKTVPDNLVARLGAANVFGWMAYTIYDNFLDEEGDPKLLSVSNVALRESAETFADTVPQNGFPDFSKRTFDTIDSANYWEVTHCRDFHHHPNFGSYLQLANKSLGHALGPAAILFTLGYKENSKEVKSLMKFFKHYIIARQLNDDAHDWEDDLKNGRINPAGALVLKQLGNKYGLPGETDWDKCRQIFWKKVIIKICQEILAHTKKARENVNNLSIIADDTLFLELLSTIDRSAQKALTERKEMLKFLRVYKM